jgi:acetyl esterase/lipase
MSCHSKPHVCDEGRANQRLAPIFCGKIMPRAVFALAAVAVLAALVSACSPIGILNALTPANTYTVTEGLQFGPDPRHRLDVYRPTPPAESPSPRAEYPVVVFFYGGTWISGERRDYKFLGEALASAQILTIIADYRLYAEVRYPDFLVDAARALAWAKREAGRYGGDTHRVYVMGHSSGAYNAAMLALDPRWLAAQGLSPAFLKGWIGLAGPYDFLPIENPDAKPVFFHPDYPPGSQPIDYAGKASPRAFLAAPLTDSIVNPERNTKQMAAKLSAAGVSATLKVYAGVDHVTIAGAIGGPLRWMAPVRDDVIAFVRAGR